MQNQTNKATQVIAKDQMNWFKKVLRLVKYVKKPWLVFFTVIFLSIGSGIALVAGTYLVGVSLNQVIQIITESFDGDGVFNPNHFNAFFWPIIGGLLASYLLSPFFLILMSIIVIKESQDIGFRMRRELFAKLHSIPFKTLDKKEHGDLLSRLTNDVFAITMALSHSTTMIFQALIQVLFITIALFLIAPVIAAIIIVLIPILFSFITIFLKKGMPFFNMQQKTIGDVNASAEGYYSGHKVVKSFNYNRFAAIDFNKVNKKNAFAERKALTISGSIFPYNNFINNFLVVIVISLVVTFQATNISYFTVLPGLGAGEFGSQSSASPLVIMSVFILFLRQLTSPISNILSLMNQLQMMLAGATRVYELIDLEDEAQEYLSPRARQVLAPWFTEQLQEVARLLKTGKTTQGDYDFQTERLTKMRDAVPGKNDHICDLLKIEKAHVKFENICFSYEENKPILKNVSFEALPGTSNAIVGPTGSGKTTIISLLVRYYELNSGKIIVDGQDISKVFKSSLRNNITVVLQDSFLFNESIRDNIKKGNSEATEQEIIEAAKLSNAWFFIEQLPHGLDTIVSNDSGLSEGQKQLLAIARAFLSKAKIIILDEATSYVDTKTEKQIQEGMAKLMKGRTSFIIAHRLSTIKNCDQIVVLQNGEIIETGNHAQLLNKKGLYAKLNETCLVDEN